MEEVFLLLRLHQEPRRKSSQSIGCHCVLNFGSLNSLFIGSFISSPGSDHKRLTQRSSSSSTSSLTLLLVVFSAPKRRRLLDRASCAFSAALYFILYSKVSCIKLCLFKFALIHECPPKHTKN